MSSARLASTPIAPREVWGRLGLLAAVLAATVALAALVVAWLVPAGPAPWSVEYRLADLAVGVPEFHRPFDMGYDAVGRPQGIWLVRTEDGDVIALWSRTAHPRDCNLRPWVGQGNAFSEALTPRIPTADGQPRLFRTSCLSSTFLLDGTRIFGPASRGLDSFPTRVEGGTVKVDLTRIILGCAGSPLSSCGPLDERPTQRASWRGGR